MTVIMRRLLFLPICCWISSAVGRRPGKNFISINKYCVSIPGLTHLMMHTLGLYHEQAKPTRDQYITVHWNNIRKGKEHLVWFFCIHSCIGFCMPMISCAFVTANRLRLWFIFQSSVVVSFEKTLYDAHIFVMKLKQASNSYGNKWSLESPGEQVMLYCSASQTLLVLFLLARGWSKMSNSWNLIRVLWLSGFTCKCVIACKIGLTLKCCESCFMVVWILFL